MKLLHLFVSFLTVILVCCVTLDLFFNSRKLCTVQWRPLYCYELMWLFSLITVTSLTKQSPQLIFTLLETCHTTGWYVIPENNSRYNEKWWVLNIERWICCTCMAKAADYSLKHEVVCICPTAQGVAHWGFTEFISISKDFFPTKPNCRDKNNTFKKGKMG